MESFFLQIAQNLFKLGYPDAIVFAPEVNLNSASGRKKAEPCIPVPPDLRNKSPGQFQLSLSKEIF
jgi:hypothetical protein